MQKLLIKAREIAENADVSTAVNGAVVYSVSYMPTDKNKLDALAYVKEHPDAKILDNTPAGQALIALGLDGKVNEVEEEISKIWRIVSARYIAAASGNITAFVEGADERSTFCTTELAEIMKNQCITDINGITKKAFAEAFFPKRY